ncbi:hypothetical protein [Actinomyces minihominis]|uniref:hypothetical protein n=1 Tax=Actinomyces minihominis TaxID=2002838 RepID=UPI000C073F76|nr:hypothetical protein [Actinomyces minihominis]
MSDQRNDDELTGDDPAVDITPVDSERRPGLTSEETDAETAGFTPSTEHTSRFFDNDVNPRTEEEFIGFEENVSVSDRSFSAASQPVEDVLAQRAPTPVDGIVEVDDAVTVEEAVEDPTQVLRRSFVQGDIVSPEPAPGTTLGFHPAEGSATFEEAMSTPAQDYTFEGEALPVLPGRGLPRFLSVLLTLIFTPVAWYLIADSAARLAFATDNPMTSGVVNVAALGELLAGLIALAIIAILAAQSSLGLLVVGVLVMAAGAPFLFVPGLVADTGYWGASNISNWNDFGGNIANHFLASGFTGLLFVFGFLMVAFGWVIAAVRRTGRAEEALRISVATTNPNAMKARWGRKATEKAQRYQ